MRLAPLVLLLLIGCGTAPLAVDLAPRVQILLASQDVPAGESIPVEITNRSRVPIYLMNACAPSLEVSDHGTWTRVPFYLLCILDSPDPQELAPGETTLRTIITEYGPGRGLPPATYRAEFKLSGPAKSFSTFHTREFTLR